MQSNNGRVTDKLGVTRPVIPKVLGALLHQPNPEKSQRTLKAMLRMDEIERARQQEAYDG